MSTSTPLSWEEPESWLSRSMLMTRPLRLAPAVAVMRRGRPKRAPPGSITARPFTWPVASPVVATCREAAGQCVVEVAPVRAVTLLTGAERRPDVVALDPLTGGLVVGLPHDVCQCAHREAKSPRKSTLPDPVQQQLCHGVPGHRAQLLAALQAHQGAGGVDGERGGERSGVLELSLDLEDAGEVRIRRGEQCVDVVVPQEHDLDVERCGVGTEWRGRALGRGVEVLDAQLSEGHRALEGLPYAGLAHHVRRVDDQEAAVCVVQGARPEVRVVRAAQQRSVWNDAAEQRAEGGVGCDHDRRLAAAGAPVQHVDRERGQDDESVWAVIIVVVVAGSEDLEVLDHGLVQRVEPGPHGPEPPARVVEERRRAFTDGALLDLQHRLVGGVGAPTSRREGVCQLVLEAVELRLQLVDRGLDAVLFGQQQGLGTAHGALVGDEHHDRQAVVVVLVAAELEALLTQALLESHDQGALFTLEAAHQPVARGAHGVGLQDARDLPEQRLTQIVQLALEARARSGGQREEAGPPWIIVVVDVDEVTADPALRCESLEDPAHRLQSAASPQPHDEQVVPGGGHLHGLSDGGQCAVLTDDRVERFELACVSEGQGVGRDSGTKLVGRERLRHGSSGADGSSLASGRRREGRDPAPVVCGDGVCLLVVAPGGTTVGRRRHGLALLGADARARSPKGASRAVRVGAWPGSGEERRVRDAGRPGRAGAGGMTGLPGLTDCREAKGPPTPAGPKAVRAAGSSVCSGGETPRVEHRAAVPEA